MKLPSQDDLQKAIHFDPEHGRIMLNNQRLLLLHASAFNALRTELIDSLGLERAKGLLMRMGYEAGKRDSSIVNEIRPDADFQDAFAVGPQLHALEGIVLVEPVSLEMDRTTGDFYGEFIWINSSEAEEHIKTHGIHSEPVCWSQIGYASGYSSSFMGREIVYKEIECIGKGDKRCRIIGKPIQLWEDAEKLHQYFTRESLAETIMQLTEKVQNLEQNLQGSAHLNEIICESPIIKRTIHLLNKAAHTDVGVLFLGETGTGKDTYARIMHNLGQRNDAAYVSVNCAALPRDLVEAELFGVEKGAYTGASHSRAGRFERAHGGTIFLDEIGEMPLDIQSKLLRVLQTGDFDRVGDTNSRRVDVRVIAATNAPLEELVSAGKFRADLYYRLNVFPIYIPPLRKRMEDLPYLIETFIGKFNAKYCKSVKGITDELMSAFMAYHWPGNIRELENIIERGIILTDNGLPINFNTIYNGIVSFQTKEWSSSLQGSNSQNISTSDLIEFINTGSMSLEALEQNILDQALEKSNGNYSAAARMLGMSVPQYRYRMKKKTRVSS